MKRFRTLASSALGLTAAAVLLAGLVTCKRDAPAGAATATAAGGDHPSQANGSAPLAVVNGRTITVEDFQRELNQQSPYVRPRYQSLAKKKEFLEGMIRFEILAQEAERRGLDRDPDVVRAMKQTMIQKLVTDEFEKKIRPAEIPESELRAFFEAHKSEYDRPEEVRVSAIVVDDAATAKKVAALAKGKDGATNKGFRELVLTYSTDEATKVRAGDLQYLTADSAAAPGEVVRAAFATTRTGEVVGPIAAGGRYYVIKQTGRKKAVDKSFEDVEASIRNRVYREQRAKAQRQFIEGLRANARIDIDEASFEKIQIDPAPAEVSPHGDASQVSPQGDASQATQATR